MNKKSIISLLLFGVLLSAIPSCNEDYKDSTPQFYGKWTIVEILLKNPNGDIQILTEDYEKCTLDDVLVFTISRQLIVNEVGERCTNVTYPYLHELELTIDSEGKVVGFQVSAIHNQVYHPLIETSDYFFVESSDMRRMEITNLTHCENQGLCRRIIKLTRL